MKSKKFDLDRIVFIGRTFEEYRMFFDLDEENLRLYRVLDCPAGCSSFTAGARNRGIYAVAADILFNLPNEKLIKKGKNDLEYTLEEAYKVPQLYNWDFYGGQGNHRLARIKALSIFENDYHKGKKEGKYVPAALPELPFLDQSFNLVLSSHFLFLYGDRVDMDFHTNCLREFYRVTSSEVRVYPLTGLDVKPSGHLPEVMKQLESENIKTEIKKVPFEFQKGSDTMLVMTR